ncbi:hypothetical protein PLESTB_001137100 [Pleodorina starrii]|uniref:Mitochondrial import inner membrane translocase subunit TIM23 n=1 Tax=Pleodorina starrii TaxID=330485 RepID=A0A9W6BS39_9CHLO|nr:hypothetical protein PLESTM_000567700 [Pleodorina starrii]GLC56707.1 hypothetical protein PLESTB_001137100 [Pleodorina starrii]GLC66865.1 hypothetical protein PLESTF_000484600 [Pleodorina starrii]
MGLLDRLSGRKAREEPQVPEPTAPAPEPVPSLPSTSPHSDALRDVSPNNTLLASATMTAPQGRLYNPYEGLTAQVGPTKHVFRLPEGPEFVFEEEASVRRRDWTQHLQFYCGGGYLAGGVVGVACGLYKFAVDKPEIVTDTLKLKTNRLLNTTGSFARPFSNSCGILGLYFSGFESLYVYQLEQYGLPDSVSTLLAGFTSGALFRLPRGPRQAVVAGAVGVAAAGGITALRKVFPSL